MRTVQLALVIEPELCGRVREEIIRCRGRAVNIYPYYTGISAPKSGLDRG